MEELELYKEAIFVKSFYMLGDSLPCCYDCKYCRLEGEKEENHYHILPEEINPLFNNLPIAINLFYGDPLLQLPNTLKLIKKLEEIEYKGPVVLITKGNFEIFPDIPINLDFHVAFSTFGKDSPLDGNTMNRFENSLKQTKLRKNNYKYSIEFRPICYGINDDEETFRRVLSLAKEYNLAIGYSGLQGKEECVKLWKERDLPLKPYPGYTFGHKKIISKEKQDLFEKLAKEYNVPIFRKTSCLISYVHNLDRDYNAHYYRPIEMNCKECPMHEKCMDFKNNLTNNLNIDIPFAYEIIDKSKHECILKKQGICKFPSPECSSISGKLIKINEPITTTDVRVIKWLTGYTVDADFIENPYLSKKWLKQK